MTAVSTRRGVGDTMPAIAELVASLDAGEHSAEATLAGAASRVAASNGDVNAIVTAAPEATAAAREIDAGGSPGTPLRGVPFTVKDALQTAGLRTTAGSLLLADNVPARDAPAVARLRDAGAILVGKTNCAEFAMDIHTTNRVFGPTANPLDRTRTSGGSSGGDSAAVAAGYAAFGLGTDYGGSIRWPAHCTGLAALRPTAGLVPSAGLLPSASPDPDLPPNSLSLRGQLHTVAPIARCVADVEAVMRVLAGDRLGDPRAVDVERLACAWIDGEGTVPVREDLVGAVAAAAAALESAGLGVARMTPPRLSEAVGLYRALRAADGLEDIARLAAGREDLLTVNSREWLAAARHATVAELQDLAAQRDALLAELLGFMSDRPIWLMPVASVPAFELPADDPAAVPAEFDVDGVSVPRYDIVASCWAISLLGVPAAVVPCGRSREGLPVGVQVVGRPYRDHEVLAVAAALESRLGDAALPASNVPQRKNDRSYRC